MLEVVVFKTTAILEIDFYNSRETEPMYAAMIPDGEGYLCCTQELISLPRALGRISHENNEWIRPHNLQDTKYFKEINFGDGSEQRAKIKHEPLSNAEFTEFISSAIHNLGFYYNMSNEASAMKELERLKKLEEYDQDWMG